MNRYLVLLFCMAISLTLLSGCRSNSNYNLAGESENTINKTDLNHPVETTDWELTTYEIVNNFDGVIMIEKENTVSSSGLTVIFKNNTDKQCIYGEYYILEKRINQKWYLVPAIIDNYGFNLIGYDLPPGNSREMEVNWEWLYGNLDAGEYRIVKDILNFGKTGDYDKYYLAAEFTVD